MIDQSLEFSNNSANSRNLHGLCSSGQVICLSHDWIFPDDSKLFGRAEYPDHLPDHWGIRFKNVGSQRTIGVVDERLRCYRSKR
jgi:hypothetical protein